MKLSAVVITLNEEREIGRALDALSFCDEVVVVDSGSVDRTVEECRARGARVLARPFDGFGPQKRFAVAQASHDWVLCVDADEVITPELAREIRTLLDAGPPPCAGYWLPFKTVFMGRVLQRGARETHLRLFDRRRASWTDASVHEEVIAPSPVGRLSGAVLHWSARDLSEAIQKLDHYTTRAALDLRARGKRRSAGLLLFIGCWHFLRHWLFRGHVLNGVPGLAWSILFATGSAVKHLKVHELDVATAPRGAAPGAAGDGALRSGEPAR